MTTRTHKLSAAQQVYKTAKAHEDSLLAQVGPLVDALLASSPVDTDEQIDAYCEQEAKIHQQFGTLQAEQNRRKAEDALLAWGAKQAQKMPGYNGIIQEVIQSKSVHFRQRAIEIIMKM